MSNKDLPGFFIEQTDARLVRIEDKIDRLIAFKWQVIGGCAALSAVVSIAVQIALAR